METRGKNRHFISSSVALVLLCSLICVTSPELVAAGAQDPDFYYYYGARKIPLTLSTEKLAVRFKQGVSLEQKRAIVDSEKDLVKFSERKELSIFELTLLPVSQGVTEENITEIINSLNGKSGVGFVRNDRGGGLRSE